jgi:hypothetical protein
MSIAPSLNVGKRLTARIFPEVNCKKATPHAVAGRELGAAAFKRAPLRRDEAPAARRAFGASDGAWSQ